MIRSLDHRLKKAACATTQTPDLVCAVYLPSEGEAPGGLSTKVVVTTYLGGDGLGGFVTSHLTADEAEAHAANLLACAARVRANTLAHGNNDSALAHYTGLAALAQALPRPALQQAA